MALRELYAATVDKVLTMEFSFKQYVSNLFWEALWASVQRIGSSSGALIFAVLCLCVLGFWIYREKGWSALKEHLTTSILKFISVPFLVWLPFFVFDLMYTSFELWQKEFKRATQAEKINEKHSKAFQDLEAKLKKDPQIIWRDKPQGGNDAEVARLRAELDQRERKKAIRTEIGKLLDEGNALRYSLLVKEEKPELLQKADAWNTKTYKYLRSVDPSYASRFDAATGLSFSYNNVPQANEKIINFLRPRLEMLTVFLGELRD